MALLCARSLLLTLVFSGMGRAAGAMPMAPPAETSGGTSFQQAAAAPAPMLALDPPDVQRVPEPASASALALGLALLAVARRRRPLPR